MHFHFISDYISIATVQFNRTACRVYNRVRVALTDRLNIPPNLSHSAKTVLKIDSYSGWGGVALRVLGGCTYTFFL